MSSPNRTHALELIDLSLLVAKCREDLRIPKSTS